MPPYPLSLTTYYRGNNTLNAASPPERLTALPCTSTAVACTNSSYGSDCALTCQCSSHGSCDSGVYGQGCICESGWSGETCHYNLSSQSIFVESVTLQSSVSSLCDGVNFVYPSGCAHSALVNCRGDSEIRLVISGGGVRLLQSLLIHDHSNLFISLCNARKAYVVQPPLFIART